jgi:FkbM family methyltransferase
MKLKDLPYVLGLRPAPKTYSSEIVTFQLPQDGRVEYARWLHPGEKPKTLRQPAVDELRQFIRAGDVAIDIGAHTGDTTLAMALAAGPDGCVLAFEPNPYVFPVLHRNAGLNAGRVNVIPIMLAATAAPGDVEFNYSDSGFCNGGRHPGISRWRHGHAFRLTVRGDRLPDFLAREYASLIPRIRFIKIDTEGYDYDVIVSCRDLIAAQKPFLRAEVFKLLPLPRRQQLYDLVIELGYEIFVIESESNYRGRPLTRAALAAPETFDVFCVPR